MRWVKARFDLSPAVRLICFAALLALLGVVPSPARSAPSLNSYVAGSDMRSVSLAPDGRHAAVVRRFSKDSFLLNVIDISGESRVIFSLKDDPDMAIIGVRWVSNTRLVMTIFGRTKISGTDYPYTRMIAMDADGSNQQPLMTEERELRLNLFLSNILSTLPQDNAHILALGYDNGPAIYKVDVYSGAAEQVAKGNSQTIGWRFGDRGEAKLRIDYSKFSRVLKIYAPEGRRWKRILKIRTSDEEEDAIKNRAGLDDSGQVLLLDRKAGSDFIGLHVYDLNSRQLMRTIFEADGYDIDDTIEHPQTGEVIGVTYISDRPQQVYFDPKLQRVQAELERQFPNGIVSIIASSDNLRKHLFYTEAPWRPGSYYIYDAVAPGLLLLGHAVPDFGDRPYTASEVVKYGTADGALIEGYLSFPMDGELKNLPLIVYPHGGPQSRDWLAFDPLAQYWASQGYLVFQPNFRGSTGYGKAFEEAGYQQYGGRILDDIESGIRALIKAGYADPDRICVAGMSFGGYAAVAMAAFKPGLVKCAISINGLHDLPFRITNKLKDVKDRELRFDVRDFFDRTVGNIDTQRDLLERHSTVLHAASVNVPILLIHADDDENVEVEHSIRMEAALKKAGKDVQLIRLPKGGHSLKTGGALRTTILESMQFFRAHL